MEVNRKKLIYAILREINNQNYKSLQSSKFNIDERLFNEVIAVIDNCGFASGFRRISTSESEYDEYIIGRVRIEYEGIEFLEKNNKWNKLYSGLKEIKKWIVF